MSTTLPENLHVYFIQRFQCKRIGGNPSVHILRKPREHQGIGKLQLRVDRYVRRSEYFLRDRDIGCKGRLRPV
eukprot:1268597-Karenia_brevis.AAC.1